MTNETVPPPRPKRIEFATPEEYRRAYGRWRDKYDPKRIASRNERSRASYEKNKEKRQAYARDYFAEHKAERVAYSREYRRQRYADDPEFREREQERSKEVMRLRRIEAPDLMREINERWRNSHKPEIAAANKKWRIQTGYDTGPERLAYREANREKIAARQRDYYAANAEKAQTSARRWREENYAEYYEKNRARILGYGRRWFADRLQAQPPWLTEEQVMQIAEIYDWARQLTQLTGVPHAVDHIWPLKGKTSCGLHVPWNLRVISHVENSRKGNKEPHA